MRLVSAIAFLFVVTACGSLSENEEEDPIARVFDRYLYYSDIAQDLPENLSPEDSASRVNGIVNRWIDKQLVLYRAENNLSAQQKNVDRQLENYRMDLLIYAYERELINQKMDTVVSDEEIEAYYLANKENFLLSDYIVKAYYVKLDTNAPRMDEVKRWMVRNSEDDFIELENYCRQFALGFYLDENAWLYLDDLLREVPIDTYNKEQLLRNTKVIEFSTGSLFFLVKIKDYRLRDSVSPLSMETENIRNMILNKRKQALLERIRKDLHDEALRNNDFEVFN